MEAVLKSVVESAVMIEVEMSAAVISVVMGAVVTEMEREALAIPAMMAVAMSAVAIDVSGDVSTDDVGSGDVSDSGNLTEW